MRIYPTKYREIGYACTAPSLWRFIDVESEKEVGPQYRSRDELLADVDSYYQRAWAPASDCPRGQHGLDNKIDLGVAATGLTADFRDPLVEHFLVLVETMA